MNVRDTPYRTDKFGIVPSQTWNFSTIKLDPAPAFLQTYAVTTGAPSASSFPTATLIQRTGLTNAGGVTYHRVNTSEWAILGDVDSTGVVSVDPDPTSVFKYPFTINSTFKDTFYLQDPDFGDITAKTTVLGDAWGTVQTPLGSFNSLRVKRISTASLSFFGVPVDIEVTATEWWTGQHSAPVLSHNRTIVISALIPGTGRDTSYDGTILTAQTVGNQEIETNYIAKAFPSPANTSMTLDVEIPTISKVAALIISSNGQTMRTRNFGDLQAGKQQVSFDVSDLPSGSYQVILMSDKGKLGTQKIVVMH